VKENVFDGVKEKTDVLTRYYQLKEDLEAHPELESEIKDELEAVEKQVNDEKLMDLQWQIERVPCPFIEVFFFPL
jgi:hypothetical protein